MSEHIPDFGPKADAAVKEAVCKFPATFRLRNHDGLFRVSLSASYVSRGVVMVYTQRQWSLLEFKRYYNKPAEPTEEDRWVDFAKGTVEELMNQVVWK